MNAFSIPGAPAWFNLLLNLSFQAVLLAAIVWIVIKVFGRWIPPNWRALMWSLVIVRSLIPFAPPSHFSIQNLFAKAPARVTVVVERPTPVVQFVQPVGSNLLYNPISHTLPIEQSKAAPSPQPNGRPLTVAWGIGAIFFGGLLIARTLIIRRALVRTGVEPASAILNILAGCREAFGARYPVRVTASDQIASPALTGFLPARLIIPTAFTTDRYTPSQIRHILLHELAHIQQGHLILHWFALIGRVLHWFNPAIHFAAAQMRQECELAADNAALKNSTPEERAAYGETILQVLSHSTAPPTLLALGMAEHARHLKQRLSALANPQQMHFRSVGLAFIGVLMMTGLTSAIEKQEPAPAAITDGEFKKARSETTERQSIRSKNAVSSDHLEELQNEPARNSALTKDAKSPGETDRMQKVKELLKSLEEVARQSEPLIAEHSENLRTIVGGGPTQGQIDQLNNQGPQGKKAAAALERSWNRPVGTGELPTPNPFARTNTVNTSPSRQKLYRKPETIRIDDFPLREETTLVEVLRQLGTEIRKRDPDGRGVNLVISKASNQNATGPAGIDPLTGLPLKPQRTDLDPEDFKIKFDPPIRDVTLGQFLNAIVMVAQPPQPPPAATGLRYAVEDYAIVFSVFQKEPVAMYSRTFRLNPNTFRQGFEPVTDFPNTGNAPQAANSGRTFVTTVTNLSPAQIQLRTFLAAAGVDFPTNNVAVGNGAVPSGFGAPPPEAPQQKAIFFNERTGVLMVRAPLQDLNTIENALHTLNTQASHPPGKPPEDLVTRTYKVDRDQFKKQLEGVRPRIVGTQLHDIAAQVYAFAEPVGINFPTNNPSSWPGDQSRKAIFYNDSTGHLFARATAQELDRLERAIANPNLVPPQVTIAVRAYEIPGEKVAWIKTNFVADRAIMATNEFLIDSTNAANPPAPLLEQTKQIVASMKNAQIATNLAQASEYIIAHKAVKSLLQQLDGVKGVDAMAMPNVTTLVGRQARISVEETLTVVTPDVTDATKIAPVQIPFGWVFDCFPESFDGAKLQITMAAAQTKFLGYEKESTAPAPRIHVEATGSRANIPVGSSQAFLLPVPNRKDLPVFGDLPFLGRRFRSEQERRHILILITPVVIDAAGNPVFPMPE